MNFLGFGNGSDGDLVISGATTDAPIDSSCSGTAESNSLSATNASFDAGQFILIHQTRGTNAGKYEVNKIASYTTGTITTVHPLVNTYTDSGASQAQVVVMKQYRNVTVNNTLTAKAWTGDVGGIVTFLVNGKLSGTGTINLSGKGFLGATAVGVVTDGKQGEGSAAARDTQANTANGNGGGGGDKGTASPNNIYEGSGGGGGGNGAAGTSGGGNGPLPSPVIGDGGAEVGEATVADSIFFGGGGGGGGGCSQEAQDRGFGGVGGSGGNGAGILFVCARNVDTSNLTINCNGAAGGTSAHTAFGGGGGGGAGGTVLIKSVSSSIGTNKITASGGAGELGTNVNHGGNGAVGRVRIESCSVAGTSTPTASTQGGQAYCSSLTLIQ